MFSRRTASEARPDEQTAELFARLHDLLVDVGGIRRDNCKSRALALDDYLIGDGNPGRGGRERGFVHLDVRFMEGRSAARELLLACFQSANATLDLQLTVEVGDIEGASYFKHPAGTLTPQ